jgi:hypothetical protein
MHIRMNQMRFEWIAVCARTATHTISQSYIKAETEGRKNAVTRARVIFLARFLGCLRTHHRSMLRDAFALVIFLNAASCHLLLLQCNMCPLFLSVILKSLKNFSE